MAENDDSLFLLDDTMVAFQAPAILANKGADFSFINHGSVDHSRRAEGQENRQQATKGLDVTFADFLNASQTDEIKEGKKTKSSSSGRPSKQSSKLSEDRLSKGSQGSSKRARWSLPSETNMEDEMTLSERYANRKLQKGKTSEELQLEEILMQKSLIEKKKTR